MGPTVRAGRSLGVEVSNTLSFPVDYGVSCSSYQSAGATSTFELDNVADGSTIEITGSGSFQPTDFIFEATFTSTTWYNDIGWGNDSETGDPRLGCPHGNTSDEIVRVTSGSQGVTLRDDAALRITIPSGENCGSKTRVYLSELVSPAPDTMYARYYIAFGENFDALQNGKNDRLDRRWALRGAAVKARVTVRTAGRHAPNIQRAAVAVRKPRFLKTAISTTPTCREAYGENFDWSTSGCGEADVSVQGEWQCVEQRVTMNTGSNNDGVYQVWVDGVEQINRTDMKWDTTGTYPISKLWINIFHGGFAGRAPGYDGVH